MNVNVLIHTSPCNIIHLFCNKSSGDRVSLSKGETLQWEFQCSFIWMDRECISRGRSSYISNVYIHEPYNSFQTVACPFYTHDFSISLSGNSGITDLDGDCNWEFQNLQAHSGCLKEGYLLSTWMIYLGIWLLHSLTSLLAVNHFSTLPPSAVVTSLFITINSLLEF